MNSPLHRIIRNFGMVLSGQGAVTVLGFLALSINSRALGMTDLGRLFLIQATCELISKLVAFQNWQSYIKVGADIEGRGSLTRLWLYGLSLDFAAGFIASIIATVILLFAPEVIGLDPEIAHYGLLYAASLLLSGSETSIGVLRLFEAYGKVVWISILQAALLFGNAAVLAVLNAPLSAYLYTLPIIISASSIAMMFIAWKQLRVRDTASLRRRFDIIAQRRFLRFAFGISASSMLTAMRQRGEVLIVGALLGPSAAALFGVAYRLAALFSRFAEAARVSVYPEFSRLVSAGLFEDAVRLAFRLTRWASGGAFAAMLVLALAGSPILVVLFGEEYRVAAPILMLLATGTAVYTCVFALGPLTQITFGSWRLFGFNLLAFVGFLCFAVLGPLMFGQNGAGAGAAAYSIVLALLLLWQVTYHRRKTAADREPKQPESH
nr:lipopolysaccharide biosynthesis protein [uncultured Celeribacter sp.]